MSPTPYPAGVGDQPQRLVSTCDMNADGQEDLVWQNHQTNEIYVEIVTNVSNPTPTYTKHSLGFVKDPNWHAEGVTDWSGDGSKPDIMFFHQTKRIVYQWLVEGLEVKSGRMFLTNPVSEGWRLEATGNFDGDEDASDLAWRNYRTNKIAVWRVSYTMPYQWWMWDGPKDLNWAPEAADDFDGDSRPDILWRNYANGKQCIWFLNPRDVKGVQMIQPFHTNPQAWDIEGVGDFNSDLHDDIVYRNYQTGEVIAWLMQNETQKVGERLLMTKTGA